MWERAVAEAIGTRPTLKVMVAIQLGIISLYYLKHLLHFQSMIL